MGKTTINHWNEGGDGIALRQEAQTSEDGDSQKKEKITQKPT